MQIHVDPDPDPGHKKLNFYIKNILKLDNISKNIRYLRFKSLLERQETRFIF
jgi:hypothetical protein